MVCDVDAGLTDKAAKLSRNILRSDKGSLHVSKDEIRLRANKVRQLRRTGAN